MKIDRFLLVDSVSPMFTDLITFNESVYFENVIKAIDKVKEDLKFEYTNEDIYNGLETLGVGFTIDFIGTLETIEY